MAGHQRKKNDKPKSLIADKHVSRWIGDPDYTVLTIEEVRERLLRIRDGAIQWITDLMERREGTGMAIAFHALQRANAEMDRLEDRELGRSSNGTVNLLVNGFDISRLQFGANAKPATATKIDG